MGKQMGIQMVQKIISLFNKMFFSFWVLSNWKKKHYKHYEIFNIQTLSYSIKVRSLIKIPLNHNLIKFRMRIQKESDPILPGMHRTTSRNHGRHVLCNFEGADNHEKIKDVLYVLCIRNNAEQWKVSQNLDFWPTMTQWNATLEQRYFGVSSFGNYGQKRNQIYKYKNQREFYEIIQFRLTQIRPNSKSNHIIVETWKRWV